MGQETGPPGGDDLAQVVRDLRGEARDLRRVVEHHTTALKVRTVVVAALLAALAVAGAGVAVELHQQVTATRRAAADQRRLCPLVELLIPRPGDAPPLTRRGIEMTQAARDYATAIHC